MIIKDIFENNRIVGLAGDMSTGKTNNLIALIKDFRKHNKETPIYVYGFNEVALNYLNKLDKVIEFSSLNQLSSKTNSLIIIDQFERLKLSDRRYKDLLDSFIDFINHSNNWVIFCTPNLREFNSIIGSKIERWVVKSLSENSLVNGSQLKTAVNRYKGRYKVLDDIRISNDKLLILNDDYEKIIELEYIKEVDNKKQNVNIFEIVKK